jgi:hypothetical protein
MTQNTESPDTPGAFNTSGGPNGGASPPVWWGARRRWVSTLAGQERVILKRRPCPCRWWGETDSWWGVVPRSTSIRPLMSPC